MYAMVEIQGKQYKAEQDALLKVDRLSQEEGAALELEQVLLLSSEKGVKVGSPFVKGATVKAVVEKHIRDPKVRVLKFKRRKNYARLTGHRQAYSLVRVKEITG
ncbi:MAG: 50S ribosomal protein L21 [Alkalispirochaetaceae bacterium]